jgi:hypothetical protein
MSLLQVAAVLCLFTLGVHGFVGQRRVVGPLMRAECEPFARATLVVVWHMVTWTLALASVGLVLGALGKAGYAGGVGLLCAGYALLFVVVARRLLGAAIRLPQWMLLGGVAVFALAGSAGSAAVANAALAGVLSAAAVVHVLWALGSTWPAGDVEGLALAVIGRKTLPSKLACWTVAFVLFSLSALVAVPSPKALRLGVALLFVLRGSVGFVEPWLRREIVGTPYLLYSRYMYTPLSLALGVAIGGTA